MNGKIDTKTYAINFEMSFYSVCKQIGEWLVSKDICIEINNVERNLKTDFTTWPKMVKKRVAMINGICIIEDKWIWFEIKYINYTKKISF